MQSQNACESEKTTEIVEEVNGQRIVRSKYFETVNDTPLDTALDTVSPQLSTNLPILVFDTFLL